MDGCEKWLKGRLSKGAVLCDIIREEAKKYGFNRKQLKEARKNIGVKTYHQFDGKVETEDWYWYLGERLF